MVCMNRLHHLKKTLPKNIEDNAAYENIEFIVVNYNSKDGLDDWVNTEMQQYLSNGILRYYKTTEPATFQMSHAKNVAAKLAKGEVICTVDADNYLGVGFAGYIDQRFREDNNIYMAVDIRSAPSGSFGRICFRREDFMILTGYDENMKGYGFEDHDFRNRLELLGRRIQYITNTTFLETLKHGDKERLENESNACETESIYIRHIDLAVSELLYLFNSKEFRKGKIIIPRFINSNAINNLFEQYRSCEYPSKLENDAWEKGFWSATTGSLTLRSNNGQIVDFKKEGSLLKGQKKNHSHLFFEVVNEKDKNETIMFYSQINNRIRMKKNKERKLIAVNLHGFGEVVFQ